MTNDFIRDGVGVTDPVLADSGATYTPGISERRGGVTSYLHSGLKNADAQSGSSQTVNATRKYDAWGNTRSSTGTWQGPFGHAGGFGYQSSDRSGLQLLGHRYYDPETGRFLTRDPIKDGNNWHAYGGGEYSPVGMVDPDGLEALRTALKIGGGLALADGPLPIGDAILLGIVIVGGVVVAGEILSDLCRPAEAKKKKGSKPNVPSDDERPPKGAEHTKGKRPSTKDKHQKGTARREADQRRKQNRPYGVPAPLPGDIEPTSRPSNPIRH